MSEKIDKRRTEKLREDADVKESFTRKLVMSRLQLTRYVESMEGLTKREDAFRVEGRRRRGRPIRGWEDCVKRDLAGVGGGE